MSSYPVQHKFNNWNVECITNKSGLVSESRLTNDKTHRLGANEVQLFEAQQLSTFSQ